MISVDDRGPMEAIREALAHLYEPAALVALPLAARLVEQRMLRSPEGLYDLLLTTIDRLKPPDGAPPRSHGWRCYRYLYLRYVECVTNEAIAREFEISARHAGRLHLEALDALARLLYPSCNRVEGFEHTPLAAREPSQTTVSPLESELAAVGRQPPEGAVDVAEVALGVAETLRQVTARHRVRLDPQFPEHLSPVRVNRVCLRQVILNVLLHLIQSVVEGSVLVTGASAPNAVILTLQGRPDHHDTDARTRPSSGGEAALSAAKQLARLQRITLSEDETTVLTYRLRLPAGVTRTVLLVDDNPDVGDLFRRMLVKSSYHLTHCRTADRALHLVRTNPPDVIVLDIVLPSTDGWELLAELRRDAQSAEIPVIVCSVLPDQEVALSLGVAGFVAKPVSRGALLQALERVFGGT